MADKWCTTFINLGNQVNSCFDTKEEAERVREEEETALHEPIGIGFFPDNPPTLQGHEVKINNERFQLEFFVKSNSHQKRISLRGFSIGNFSSGQFHDFPLSEIESNPGNQQPEKIILEVAKPVDPNATDFWLTLKSGPDAPFDSEIRGIGEVNPIAGEPPAPPTTPPPPPPPGELLPGFWERIKGMFKDALQRLVLVLNIDIISAFNTLHNLLKGTDIDEQTAIKWAEFVPGLNAANKVAFGTDIAGRPNDTVTTGELIELGLFIIPLPVGWVGKLFSKVVARKGFVPAVKLLDDIVDTEIRMIERGATKAQVKEVKLLFDQVAGKEFTKAVARGLTQEELSWVVSTVTKQPLRAIELFVKTPANWEKIGFATQAKVLKALAGTSEPFAEETAKTLFRAMGGNAGFKAFAEAGKPGFWTGLPAAWKWWLGIVGAIMGTGFISSWTAKEFVWESSTFPLTDAMRKGDWQIAAEQLPRVEKTFEFIKGVINTIGWLNPISNIIFRRGLEEAESNLALWRTQIELHLPPEEPPIEPPTEPPPETPPGEEVPDPTKTPEPGKSFITIDSNPRGANIWIDGKSMFTVTPFAHLLDSGQHNIQLQLFRYEPTFETVTLEPDKSVIKTYSLTPLAPVEPEKPFLPVPIDVPLERPEVPVIKPNAWEYTITARDAETNQILNAKIIIDGIFTGDYTTNTVILEPEATYLLRLEAFGYEPGEVSIITESLPD